MLRNRLLERIFNVGSLALYHTQRNTINKQYNIGAICVAHSRTAYCKLLGYVKRIVLYVLPIDILHHIALLVAIDNLFECLARSQEVVCHLRSGHISLCHREIFECLNARRYILLRKYGCALRTNLHSVYFRQLLTQDRLEQHIARISATQLHCLGRRQIGVTHLLQHHQCRNLTNMVFFEGESHYICISHSKGISINANIIVNPIFEAVVTPLVNKEVMHASTVNAANAR